MCSDCWMHSAWPSHRSTRSRPVRLGVVGLIVLALGLGSFVGSSTGQTRAPAGKLHRPKVVFKNHRVRFTSRGYFEPFATIEVRINDVTPRHGPYAVIAFLPRLFHVGKGGRLVLRFRWPATTELLGPGSSSPVPWSRDNSVEACYRYPITGRRCASVPVKVHGAPPRP